MRKRRCFNASSIDEQLAELKDLPPQQKRVVSLVILGYTNNEIANILGITTHTVKAHIAQALRRTKTGNRCRLAFLVGSLEDKSEFMFYPPKE